MAIQTILSTDNLNAGREKINDNFTELYNTVKDGNYVIVDALADLPTQVGGVITLLPDVTYFITNNIDLLGSRLVGGSNTTIIGSSSENSILTSTGLGVGVPLLSSIYTTPIRHISINDVNTAISFDGATNPNDMALDWTGVNFVNVPNIGLIKYAVNFIFDKGAFLNSKGMLFDGSIDRLCFGNCLFSGDGLLGNIIELADTCTINRHFRIIYSSLAAFSLTKGIKVNPLTTIGIEGFILDTINFSGGGTYLEGVTYTNEEALFVNCVGIINTNAIANMYMKNNSTPTPITVIGDRYAMRGTTLSNEVNQKFTHVPANNSMRYDSTIPRLFRILITFSARSGRNNVFGIYIGVKRGVEIDPTADIISESEVYLETSSRRSETGAVQALVELNQNDEVYMIIDNTSSETNITIEFMNVVIERTN